MLATLRASESSTAPWRPTRFCWAGATCSFMCFGVNLPLFCFGDCSNNQLKLAHLGLCCELPAGAASITDPGLVTTRHMAPETIARQEFSLASDAWSFAVTAWEILCQGADPFEGYPASDLLHSLASDMRPLLPPQVGLREDGGNGENKRIIIK